jgi:hypothetical protein
VRDQRDRHLVDARVSGEGAAGELGEFPVVPAGECLADLADVLVDDVVVVEQPLRRRSDVERLRLRRADARVGVVEDPPGLLEAGQQTGGLLTGAMVPLAARELARPRSERLGAEEVPADRAGDEVLDGGTAAKQIENRRGSSGEGPGVPVPESRASAWHIAGRERSCGGPAFSDRGASPSHTLSWR